MAARAQDVAELVHPLEQAGAGEGVDGERHRGAARQREGLRGQVDGHLGVGPRGQLREERGVGAGVDGHRQQAVLQGVVLEDVGEGGADHRPEAEAGERPGGVLAGGAAAEVVAGQQHLGALRARWLSTNSGLGRAVGP